MGLSPDRQDIERPLIFSYASREFTRDDIAELLKADVDCNHPDYNFKQLLESMNAKAIGTHGQELDSDAIDRLIDDLNRQQRIRVANSSVGANEVATSSKDDDLTQKNIETKDSSPSTAYDDVKGQLLALHPSNRAGNSAIACQDTINHQLDIAVRRPPTEPPILAYCPYVDGTQRTYCDHNSGPDRLRFSGNDTVKVSRSSENGDNGDRAGGK